jgi:guanine nucleotide-binding protein alpha-1 subunit
MRTPSIYSQDDPITEALKPPSSETPAERQVRLQAEAEARRISEKIDEDLRLERERLRKNKDDVKVSSPPSLPLLTDSDHFDNFSCRALQLLLLGQAESGKSTLQKQFQLMYRPHSLDDERASWRTVIYFNVVHSIKQILSTLEIWGDYAGDEAAMDIDSTSSTPTNASPLSDDDSSTASRISIANLRRRLSPLVAADTQLGDRLSGGITVSGSGKGNVFVRSGWQARTIENVMNIQRPRAPEGEKLNGAPHDALVEDVGRMLEASKDDIAELWAHPTVKVLMVKRRLKLDEWSEL